MSDQMRRASSAGRARAVIALALVAGVLAVPAIASAGQGGPSKPSVAASQSAGAAQPGIGTPADDRWRGLKWAGLKKAAATSRCRTGYEISGPTARCSWRSWRAVTLPLVPRLNTTTWRSRPVAARLRISASPVGACRSILASM